MEAATHQKVNQPRGHWFKAIKPVLKISDEADQDLDGGMGSILFEPPCMTDGCQMTLHDLPIH